MKHDNLICPYCNYTGEPSLFPDLFYSDMDNTPALDEQYKLLRQLWTKGFNIVTCGNCGQVFIHKTEH